jgi:hypothetical protein
MTVQVHPDSCLVPLMQRIVAGDIRVKLYSNDLTPTQATVLGDFTEIAPSGGYAAGGIVVAAADFVLSGVVAHKGTLMAPAVSWTPSVADGLDVFGYYYTDTGGTILLGCARFDPGPVTWIVPVPVSVWPVFGDISLFF